MWPAILMLVFVLALLGSTLTGDSWYWAVGNGLGLLTFALLLILVMHGSAGIGNSKRHRWLGLAVVATLAGHSFWFLIGDPITLEYIKLGAPHYMVAGLLSAGLLLVLSVTSLLSFRNRSYLNHRSFRHWHKLLATLVILTALIHILLSGLYFSYYWQWIVLVLLALIAYFAPKRLRFNYAFQRRYLCLAAIITMTLFVLLRSQALA